MTTGIIATIGPSSDTLKTFTALAKEGMDIVRCNFSHCKYDEYKARLKMVREYNQRHGANLKILADLQGPRIRIGAVAEEGIVVKPGQAVTFVAVAAPDRQPEEIPVDDPYLHIDVSKGDPMLISSGAIELIVTKTFPKNHRFIAKVVVGGTIFSRKGINVPATNLSAPAFTKKDLADLKFVLKAGVDLVALSFVSDEQDILRVKKIIGRRPVGVIAKIERRAALTNIDAIIAASDGVMVARGDLGVEIPDDEVPIVQKQIVRKCHLHMKPAIVATQMLSTMVDNPFPTRAEVSDVANAVFEGAHNVMLSDETANGHYPVQAVKTMRKIVTTTEAHLGY